MKAHDLCHQMLVLQATYYFNDTDTHNIIITLANMTHNTWFVGDETFIKISEQTNMYVCRSKWWFKIVILII